MTPMTLGVLANDRAFAWHLPAVQSPASAVESSQDWYPMLKRPARNRCSRRMNLMASSIGLVCAASSPNGRSEAIRYWGFPEPL